MVMLCTLCGVVLGLLIAMNKPPYIESAHRVWYEQVIEVNGDLVDSEGRWVTNKNSRGEDTGSPRIMAKDVTAPLYVRFEFTERAKSNWSVYSGSKGTTSKLTFTQENDTIGEAK